MKRNTIISLFDHSGTWSEPYRKHGYKIVRVDIKDGIDILKWDYKSVPKNSVYGILAAPPCTHFASSGAVWWNEKDKDGRTIADIKLVHKTLEIIRYFKPVFWALENPVGRISKLIPTLKKFRKMIFNPYEYGDGYSKKTVLYGQFNTDLKKNIVDYIKPKEKHTHSIDVFHAIEHVGYKERAETRSLTPNGFAKAFYEANNKENMKKSKHKNTEILQGLDYISDKQEQLLGIEDPGLGKLTNNDVYDMVTQRILSIIEKEDDIKWFSGWDKNSNKGIKMQADLLPMPINFNAKSYYRGINALLLSYYPCCIEEVDGIKRKVLEEITDGKLFWLTFKQIKEHGGTLRKGAISLQAVYYNFLFSYKKEKISEEEYKKLAYKFNCDMRRGAQAAECGDLDKRAYLKYYNVFNERDIEGIDFDAKRKEFKEKYKIFESKREKIEVCELVVANMPKRPHVIERKLGHGDSPHYSPVKDIVVMPMREQYEDLGVFYGTLFHELTHSTGAKHRLGRSGVINFDGFGSESYAFEELVAEMGSAFLNAESGVLLSTLKKNSAYIKGWKTEVENMLKEDNKAIFKAAGQAQKAADFILDRDKEGNPAFYKDLKNELQTTADDKQKRIRIAKVKAAAKLKLLKLSGEKQTRQNKKTSKIKASKKTQVSDMLVSDIYTDEKRFQNRFNAFSDESKNRIIKAVNSGTFDWVKFDPIIIWFDKNKNKYYVLSGHSRLAAFKQLAKTDKEFKHIPVKIFTGNEKQAIETALNSNTLSTKETEVERAVFYANKRKQCRVSMALNGLNGFDVCEKKTIEEIKDAEGRNANFIANLSYLNTGGFLIQQLNALGADKDNDSANVMRIVANWIGEARKSNPEISNQQETEIAKFLLNGGYGNKKGQFKNKNAFNERLKYSFDKWKHNGAAPEQPLNLANTLSKSAHELDYDKRAESAKKALDEAVAEHKEKHDKYLFAMFKGKIDQHKLDELMKPYVANTLWHEQEYKRIKGQKEDVKKASRAQGTLFGFDRGDFGTIYTQFKDKPKQAIKHLIKMQEGEALAALYRDDIGYIDIVWGENNPATNKGFGLKHIIEKHKAEIKQLGFKVEDFIPIVVQYAEVNIKQSKKDKIIFESKMFRFIVKTTYNRKQKKWLLSAFDLRKKPKKKS